MMQVDDPMVADALAGLLDSDFLEVRPPTLSPSQIAPFLCVMLINRHFDRIFRPNFLRNPLCGGVPIALHDRL